METIAHRIIGGQPLSVSQADEVCRDLTTLDEQGVWVKPDWAVELMTTRYPNIGAAHQIIQTEAWRAVAKSYCSRTIRAHDPFEELRFVLAGDIKYVRETLAAKCRSLSKHLHDIACDLAGDTDHSDLHTNGLGEIQSQGTMIDAECGRLMAKVQTLRTVMEMSK